MISQHSVVRVSFLVLVMAGTLLSGCATVPPDRDTAKNLEQWITCGVSRRDVFEYQLQHSGITSFLCDIQSTMDPDGTEAYHCYLQIAGYVYDLKFGARDDLRTYTKGVHSGFTQLEYGSPVDLCSK